MGNKWVWLDMEMTGLDPSRDVVLEIAVAITDTDLNLIEKGPEIVIHQTEETLALMSDYVRDMHESNGLIDRVRLSKDTIKTAEQTVLAFLKSHLSEKQSPLCGNSVSYDRRFLFRYMQELESFFHYRHIDVTSLKLMLEQWCPKEKFYAKASTHRAMDDVLESIKELAFYRREFNWHNIHDHSNNDAH